LSVQLPALDAFGQGPDDRLALHPCDAHAGADVRAGAVAEVAGDASADVEAVRFRELPRVVVGAGEEDENLALRRDAGVGQGDLSGRGAEEADDR